MQLSLLIAAFLFPTAFIEYSSTVNSETNLGQDIEHSTFNPETSSGQAIQHSTYRHDFHVSIIDVNHNQEKQTLEVSIKVFIDDLEKALTEEEKAPVLFLNTKKENPKGDAYIKTYLNKQFKVTIDNQTIIGNYLGKEYENDVCWIYVEYTNIKKPKTISIQNTMLIDTFSDQANIVHFKSGTLKHSKALQSHDFLMFFNL